MLQVMCALVANEPAKQQWLRSAGILQVLYRLTLGMQPQDDDSDEQEEDNSPAMGQHISNALQRQIARLLAILSADERALVRHFRFLPYKQSKQLPSRCSFTLSWMAFPC